MPHESASARIAWICLATLAALEACSFDESKLRRHAPGDAARATDVAASSADAARDVVAARELGADTPAEVPDAGLDDGAVASGADGGLDGAGGSGDDGSSGADRAADRPPEAGDWVPLDTLGPVEDGAAVRTDPGEDAADAPQAEDTGARDGGGQLIDVPAEADAADTALNTGDGRAAIDGRDDTLTVDARGKKTCPTSISGSLDRSDPTQVGRLSRVESASVCGTPKVFPGNGADKTFSHLYDVYRFINVASTPVCFTFTLTYALSQELYAAAYSTFDPTDITTGHLGDVGNTLTPPQTMGITVGPGETIDVVVYAVAMGTDPAGTYTLGCSAQ